MQASKQASRQASKQVSKQADKQASKQAYKSKLYLEYGKAKSFQTSSVICLRR